MIYDLGFDWSSVIGVWSLEFLPVVLSFALWLCLPIANLFCFGEL